MVGLLHVPVTKKGAVKLLFPKFLQIAVRDPIAGCTRKPLEMYRHTVKRRKKSLVSFNPLSVQAQDVQMLDGAIHRINHYPVDKYWGNQLR